MLETFLIAWFAALAVSPLVVPGMVEDTEPPRRSQRKSAKHASARSVSPNGSAKKKRKKGSQPKPKRTRQGPPVNDPLNQTDPNVPDRPDAAPDTSRHRNVSRNS